MKAEEYVEYTREKGTKIIETNGIYWARARPFFYQNIPVLSPVDASPSQLLRVMSKGSYLAVLMHSSNRANRLTVRSVCDDTEYRLEKLSKYGRRDVSKGLRNCSVRQIDLDFLAREGNEINRSAMTRHGGSSSTDMSSPSKWRRKMDTCKRYDDIEAWGAFVGNSLAAYVLCIVIEDYCNINNFMSHTRFLSYCPNNALIYTMTREMLGRPGVKRVEFGTTGDIASLANFKERMGYRRAPFPFRLMVNPLARPLLSRFAKFRYYDRTCRANYLKYMDRIRSSGDSEDVPGIE